MISKGELTYIERRTTKTGVKTGVFEEESSTLSGMMRVSVKIESNPWSLITWAVTESISFHLSIHH